MAKITRLFKRVLRESLTHPHADASGSASSAYYDLERTRRYVSSGRHRTLVGGLWEEIGLLTRDFLIAEGLTPTMAFLDIGCGCLRVGVHIVDYLDPGHYFGTDLSEELLCVGYEQELRSLGLDVKLPRQNLLCDDGFDFSRFENPPRFDMALALSVFTHLPFNHLRLCMEKLETVMSPGAKLIATVFCCREEDDWSRQIIHEPGGITTYPDRNPYHYRPSDLERCIQGLPWSMTEPRQWNHPRAQAVVVLTKNA